VADAMIEAGDLIFGRCRAYQRKLALAEFDGICSAHAMVVRAKPDVILPEFLPFLMMSDCFMNRAVEISVGSLSPTINWSALKLEKFALPPLDQQRRIAAILWAADEALCSLNELEITLNQNLVAVRDCYFSSRLKGKTKRVDQLFEVQSLGKCFHQKHGKVHLPCHIWETRMFSGADLI
jgi:restriction endonuclease S subunit